MDCEYSQKIQCILEEGKRCKEKLGVFGPTGPTGPQGPATITIGTTTTGDPGTNASVTNVGTNENVILDFTIPRGAAGPQGIQGETGPTGPSGGTNIAYGRKYDTTTDTISVTADTDSVVPLTTTGPLSRITETTENVLTIEEDGIYKIDYFFNGSSNIQATLTLSVSQSTNPINSSTITKEFQANVDDILNGSVIVSLSANDEIGLGISSNNNATVSTADGVNAYLNIVKLS